MPGDCHLRAADTSACVVPPNTRFGDRSFSNSGPKIRSSLQSAIRQPGSSFAVFKQHLQSYLFNATWDRGTQRQLLLWAPYTFFLRTYVSKMLNCCSLKYRSFSCKNYDLIEGCTYDYRTLTGSVTITIETSTNTCAQQLTNQTLNLILTLILAPALLLNSTR